jgi:glycosyltransferase involved in cell wall biosynthesis
MKVLHVTEIVRGGVSTIIRLNMLGQSRLLGKHNVSALVCWDEAVDLAPVDSEQIETFEQTGRNLKSFLALATAFFKKVRREKPDIIHIHSSFAGLICRLVFIVVRVSTPSYKPVILYCPHAFGFLMEANKFKKKLYAFIEWALLPLTDAVICVSNYERDTGIKFGLNEKKLKVVYNGVKIQEIQEIQDEDKGASETTQLLFLGRLDFQKGFDLMLEAMKELEEEPFYLTVVGETLKSDTMTPERPNVTYAGWVDADKIGKYMQACDVMVMPSRWESFGLVATEAGIYERASLASDCCSLPEIVVDGKTGKLFPSGSVFDMIRLLRETSKEEWWVMGKAGRKHIVQEFSDEKMCQRTIDLYNEMIASK